MNDEAQAPAIVTYQEWIGTTPHIGTHTQANVQTAILSGGGDMDYLVWAMHDHKDLGFWIIASAPKRVVLN